MSKQELYEKRYGEFPPEIIEASYQNEVINRIAKDYACGRICFLNEALAQMVIHLNINWNDKMKEAYRLYQSFPAPIIKS